MAQQRNAELVDQLSADFPRRREPAFQWPRAVGLLQALPALRAAWVCERDLGGNAQHLSFGGNTVINHRGAAPLVEFPGGAGDSLSVADSAVLDVLGTEAYVTAALRGLTLGCWVRVDNLGSGDNYILAKWESAGATTGSYRLFHNGSTLSFSVTNGTTNYTAALASVITAGVWYFVSGRFDPSTDVFVNINGEAAGVAGSAPASLNNSTVSFRVGGRTSAADELTGAVAFPFLAGAFLPEYFHHLIFQHTRSLFGA